MTHPTPLTANESPALRSAPGRLVHRVALVGLGLILLAPVLYLAAGTYIALKLTAPDPMPARANPAAYALAFESPQIRSRDGVLLASWFIPASGSERAILMVHGLWTCRSCEFDGRFLELASQLHAAGYNILMIDLRKHGESQGEHFSFGQNERWDVLAATDWLEQRGLNKIAVLGVSLGAVSAIEAAVDPAGGENMRSLVLDSAFANLPQTLDQSFTLESGLPNQLLPGAFLMMRVLLNVDLYAIQPARQLPRIKAPVMLIYGRQDKYISPGQMEAMVAARPDAETWLVDTAGHARIYNDRPQEYVRRVRAFIDRTLQ